MLLSGIAEKVKFKALQQRAREAMDEIAAAKGMTKAELEDRIVPDCGLDEQGSRTFDFGPRQFEFGLGPGMKPMVRDESGKLRASPPKPGVRDDPELAPRRWTSGSCCASRSRTWPRSRPRGWNRRWSRSGAGGRGLRALPGAHPLQRHLVRRLVWRDAKARPFRVTDELDYADADDEPVTLDGEVGVVHPLQLATTSARLGRAARRLRDRAAVPAARPPGARRRAGRARRARAHALRKAQGRGLGARARAREPRLAARPGAGRRLFDAACQAVPGARRDRRGRVRGHPDWLHRRWDDQAIEQSTSSTRPSAGPLGSGELRRQAAAASPVGRRRPDRALGGAGRHRDRAGEGADERGARQRPPAEVLYADELARLARARRRRAAARGLAAHAARRSCVRPRRRAARHRAEVRRRARVRRPLRGRPGDQPRADAGRRARHRQVLPVASCSRRRSAATRRSPSRAPPAPPRTRSSTRGTTRCCSPRGRSERSLVPAPLLRGMREGKIVRFEEITRCPLEIQDSLLSVLQRPRDGRPRAATSGRVGLRPPGLQRHRHRQHPRPRRQRDERRAQAPLQLRDRAPDRRHRATSWPWCARDGPAAERAGIPLRLPPDVAEVLVTTFHELRSGQTAGGKAWSR